MVIKNLLFLDVDGVLNCELFYNEKYGKESFFSNITKPVFRRVKNFLKIKAKKKEIDWDEYYKGQICSKRIGWLNDLCEQTDTAVVISSTWRLGKSIEDLQQLLNNSGATFKVIGKTDHCECRTRGCEIHKWLSDNCMEFFGVNYFDFYRYGIIDDDADMLLTQQNHFFQTDSYNGLTPTICHKIKRFFTHETF